VALSDSLVRYFSLDEASGDAIDAVGGQNLTETGGTIDAVAGKVGGARDFEVADTEYFRTTAESDLRGGNTDFTIAGWFRAESRSGTSFDPIVSKWGSTHEYVLWLGGGATLLWSLAAAGGAGESSLIVGDFTDGSYYFVVAWHDAAANLMAACVNDGAVQSQAFDAAGVESSAQEFALGGGDNGAAFFDGILDEWGFWRRVLTASEITDLYNGGNGRSYAYIAPSTPTLYKSFPARPRLRPSIFSPGFAR
jgi:hypothetical protein